MPPPSGQDRVLQTVELEDRTRAAGDRIIANFDRIAAAADKTEKAVRALNRSMSGNSRVAGAAPRVETLAQNLGPVNSQLSSLERRLKNMGEAVTSVTRRLNGLKGAATQSGGGAARVAGRVVAAATEATTRTSTADRDAMQERLRVAAGERLQRRIDHQFWLQQERVKERERLRQERAEAAVGPHVERGERARVAQGERLQQRTEHAYWLQQQREKSRMQANAAREEERRQRDLAHKQEEFDRYHGRYETLQRRQGEMRAIGYSLAHVINATVHPNIQNLFRAAGGIAQLQAINVRRAEEREQYRVRPGEEGMPRRRGPERWYDRWARGEVPRFGGRGGGGRGGVLVDPELGIRLGGAGAAASGGLLSRLRTRLQGVMRRSQQVAAHDAEVGITLGAVAGRGRFRTRAQQERQEDIPTPFSRFRASMTQTRANIGDSLFHRRADAAESFERFFQRMTARTPVTLSRQQRRALQRQGQPLPEGELEHPMAGAALLGLQKSVEWAKRLTASLRENNKLGESFARAMSPGATVLSRMETTARRLDADLHTAQTRMVGAAGTAGGGGLGTRISSLLGRLTGGGGRGAGGGGAGGGGGGGGGATGGFFQTVGSLAQGAAGSVLTFGQSLLSIGSAITTSLPTFFSVIAVIGSLVGVVVNVAGAIGGVAVAAVQALASAAAQLATVLVQTLTQAFNIVAGVVTGLIAGVQSLVSTMIGAITTAGAFAGALVAGFAGIVKVTTDAYKDFNALQRGLASIMGSAEEADKEILRLQEAAKGPGLGFVQAIEGSARLQAAGLSAHLARDAMVGFGNAIARVGGGKDELEGVALALSQIAAKGQVSGEEIRQLSNRLPDMRRAMVAVYGTAKTEDLAKMGIGPLQFIKDITGYLLTLPKANDTLKNSLENLGDTWGRVLIQIGQGFSQFLMPIVQALDQMLKNLLNAHVFERIAQGLVSILSKVDWIELMKRALAGLTAVLLGLPEILDVLSNAWGEQWRMMGILFNEVVRIVTDEMDALAKFWSQVSQSVIDEFHHIAQFAKTFFSFIIEGMQAIGGAALGIAKALGLPVLGALKDLGAATDKVSAKWDQLEESYGHLQTQTGKTYEDIFGSGLGGSPQQIASLQQAIVLSKQLQGIQKRRDELDAQLGNQDQPPSTIGRAFNMTAPGWSAVQKSIYLGREGVQRFFDWYDKKLAKPGQPVPLSPTGQLQQATESAASTTAAIQNLVRSLNLSPQQLAESGITTDKKTGRMDISTDTLARLMERLQKPAGASPYAQLKKSTADNWNALTTTLPQFMDASKQNWQKAFFGDPNDPTRPNVKGIVGGYYDQMMGVLNGFGPAAPPTPPDDARSEQSAAELENPLNQIAANTLKVARNTDRLRDLKPYVIGGGPLAEIGITPVELREAARMRAGRSPDGRDPVTGAEFGRAATRQTALPPIMLTLPPTDPIQEMMAQVAMDAAEQMANRLLSPFGVPQTNGG